MKIIAKFSLLAVAAWAALALISCGGDGGSSGSDPGKDCTITYQTDRGTCPQATSVNSNEALTSKHLPSLSDTGYIFEGWQIQGAEKFVNVGDKISGDTTLVAKWKPITYTIKFDANGGEGTVESITATYDKEVALPKNDFTPPEGKKKKGWMTTKTAGDETQYYKDGEKVKNLSSEQDDEVSLYARYTNGDWIVEFLDYDKKLMKSVEVDNDKTIAQNDIPDATRDHYEFDAWYDEDDAKIENVSSIKITADRVFTAKYTPCNYTFTFESAYDLEDSEKSEQVVYDSTYTFKQLSKTGWEFLGWFYEDESGEEVKAEDKILVEKDMSFKAKWHVFTRTVTFYANAVKGQILHKSDSEIGDESYDETYKYGESAKLRPCQYYYDSYYFSGWNTKADGTGEKYEDQADYTWKGENPIDGETLSLYAQWAKKDMFNYNVTLPSPSATSADDITLSYDPKTLKLTAQKKNYTGYFYWYVDGGKYSAENGFEEGYQYYNLYYNNTFSVKDYVGQEYVGLGLHTVMVTATVGQITYSQTATIYLDYAFDSDDEGEE